MSIQVVPGTGLGPRNIKVKNKKSLEVHRQTPSKYNNRLIHKIRIHQMLPVQICIFQTVDANNVSHRISIESQPAF